MVKNWDGTVAGVENGEKRSFENLDQANENNQTGQTSASGQPSRTTTATTGTVTTMTSAAATNPPFAKINGVAPLSPAFEAGLKEDDKIVQFGEIDFSNHQNLKGLLPVVASAADTQQSIAITVLRKDQSGRQNSAQVSLTPKPWPGRGLIGCHIVPYSEGE